MEPIGWLIIVALAVATAAGALYLFNRSWGDFPGRVALPPAALPASPPRAADAPASDDSAAAPAADDPALPAEAEPDRVLVTQPLIRRAAERALMQGGPVARHLVREGDRIYFAFDTIPDPEKRQQARALLRGLATDAADAQPIDLRVALRLIRELFGS